MIKTTCNKDIRRKFGKARPILDLPDLLEIQKKSYEKFFQKYLTSDNEGNSGLLSLLKKRFPVSATIIKNKKVEATYLLEFENLRLSSPPQSTVECKKNIATYGLLFEAHLKLKRDGTEIDEQWVGLGVMPLMTDNGSFIIDGLERVVISQFYRSKGVYFDSAMPCTNIVPKYGSRIQVVTFLNETICFIRSRVSGTEEKEIQYTEGKSEPTPRNPIKRLEKLVESIGIEISTEGVTDEQARKILNYFNKGFPKKTYRKAIRLNILLKAFGCSHKEIESLFMEDKPEIDKTLTKNKAKNEIISSVDLHAINLYKKKKIKSFDDLFFNSQNYSLGREGRFHINQKLDLNVSLDVLTLTKEDVLKTVKHLFHIKSGKVKGDAIDHLGNKRVRTIEDLLANHFRNVAPGIAASLRSSLKNRIEEVQQEKSQEHRSILHELIDLETIQKIQNRVNSFFIHNELCQFLEQDNPLTDITHKRRLTILGPGGFKKDKIPNAAKQVHPTHYGRMCPIETPESASVGQILSLSTYSRINEYGFLETPYWKVEDGRVINDFEYLSPFQEEKYTIADGTEPLDENGRLKNEIISARRKGEPVKVRPEEVDHIDVSPNQILSLSGSLIPFLEHNDPTRALMAANMQRQAIPLVKPEAPLVGTGMENIVAKGSGTAIIAEKDGVIEGIESQIKDKMIINGKEFITNSDQKIIVKYDKSDENPENRKVYELLKYQSSNQSTCINQKPSVNVGDRVKKGEIIADGSATDKGELVLGRNLLVAFMPWRGYNFEDAILISENIVKKGCFTSVSIEEHQIRVEDREEVTKKLPLVKRNRLRHLGNDGIVRVGAKVKAGDVLVGKIVHKKGRYFPSLAGRILWESLKSEEVFDNTSYSVPLGVKGTVIDVRVRESGLPDRLTKIIIVSLAIKERLSVGDKMAGRHGNKGVISRIVRQEDMPFLEDGTPVDIVLNSLGVITRMNLGQILETHLGWAARELGDKIKKLIKVNTNIKGLKKFLKKIYPEGEMYQYLNNATKEEVISLAENLSNGVPMESPAFDSATEKEIEEHLKLAGLPLDGKTVLYDGVTGEPFAEKVTVGIIYMMKLHHLAEDKMHARSTGDYVSITQQPKAGKANYGGQRIGEMDAWALYGYGAAHTLREAFTIKSDDVEGRKKLQKDIALKEKFPKPQISESLKVFIKELQGLCFDVSYVTSNDDLGNNNNWISLGNENLSFPPEKIYGLKIELASPDTIQKWSYGEVIEPKIMDHRGDKYVFGGLFCQKIFGPLKDYTCACSDREKGKKYKGHKKYKGEQCKKCGVEVLENKVRKERMGCIKLATPICHILFFKEPKRLMKALFDINGKDLERVIYCKYYIVIDPGESEFEKAQLLSADEYKEAKEECGDSFEAGTGAEVIYEILKKTDIGARLRELDVECTVLSKIAERKSDEECEKLLNQVWNISRRIDKLGNFLKSGIKLDNIFLEVLPVIPPELRPYNKKEGGKTINSDLNILYQKVITINNQLDKYHDSIDLKERLQIAVDGLLANGVRATKTVGKEKRALKSLRDNIKGKEGRIRGDLLGKRVDYSGRSVIVSGPELKLHQFGLPREMALELFEPLIIEKLIKDGTVTTDTAAKRRIARRTPKALKALDEAIKGYPVLLIRNPTLHRMNIQAFEPVLVEGEAINLHPMVCASFAADFDGDAMAVHIPLSEDALKEAKHLLMSTNNILSPATGKPIIKPSQDMVLGIYYITKEKSPAKGEGKIFSCPSEVCIAFNNHEIDLHSKIKVRIDGELIKTTTGRILLKEIIPRNIPLKFDNSKYNENYNRELKNRDLSELINLCYRCCGQQETALFCDRLKELGFEQATRSGISIGIKDVATPQKKQKLVMDGYKQINKIEESIKSHPNGEEDKPNKIWDDVVEQLKKALSEEIDSYNPLSMMVNSGARGNITQLNKLAGMRGLMSDTTGEILKQPITSNFREGLNTIEYFTSNYESRKALVDKNKATQDAGYFTRRLVYAFQNCIITEKDCGTDEGIELNWLFWIINVEEIVNWLKEWIQEKILGRIACEDIINQSTGKIICKKNNEIDEEVIEKMVSSGIMEVKIRSPLTCKAEQGICALCYGWDLSRRKIVNIGEAVGIIAAQSIGEPITQFSIAAYKKGVRITNTKGSEPTKIQDFFKDIKEEACVLSKYEGEIKAIKDGKWQGEKVKRIIIIDKIEGKKEHKVQGKKIIVDEGDFVKRGDSLTEGEVNPYQLLSLKKRIPTAQFLIDNLQEFFKRQGSEVNRKHFEIFLSEMLKYVIVFVSGDTDFTPGGEVERTIIEKENEKLIKAGKEPAVFEPVLSTINKLATSSEGFLSNISFEDTPRKLAKAAIEGKIDYLKGIQENVILGKLIPVGTGHPKYTGFKI